MTTETVLVSTDWDPESPITTTLAGAWSQNWIAGFEGNSTTKIQAGAIADDAVTGEKIQSPAAGTTYLIAELLGQAVQGDRSSYYSIVYAALRYEAHSMGCVCLVDGTITCSVAHRRTNTGGTPYSYVRVLKNGTAVQSWSTLYNTWQTRLVNVTVSRGDVILFQHREDGGTGGEWRNIRIYSANPTFAVA